MIPKIIHYCWFGHNEKTKKMEACINSWKKYCPDYQIIEWNEDNFPLDEQCAFIREAYNNGKYAFVSDVVRLIVVYKYGGVYLDTDVELLKSIDELLEHPCYMGWQDDKYVANGLGFGAEKGNLVIGENLQYYLENNFVNSDGSFRMTACPVITTEVLRKRGIDFNNTYIQDLGDIIVYPTDYFNPLDDATNRLKITENTFSIHWYAKTWVSKRNKIRGRITRVFHRWFGVNCFEPIKKLLALIK